jgi:hypothetical protein
MCSLKIPQVIKQIDVYKKHCLWSKGDINRKGTCLVAWESACKPKDQGGLGIIDIKDQNNAMLLKFLDKFYSKSDIPWVQLTWSKLYANNQTQPHVSILVGSFWWKEVIGLFNKFQTMARCKPNRGGTILFWSQIWIGHDQPFKELYPKLFSFTKKPRCSIQYFIEQDENRLFSLPLSQQVAMQLEQNENFIQHSDFDENVNDTWSYTWGSIKYSSSKAYKILQGHSEASPLFSWLWASSNLGKHKFFF